jgi:hypothetical protein
VIVYPSALNPQPGAGRNPNALRLSIGINATGQRVGVANKGFYGIGIRPSTRYQVSFFAKADAALGGRLTVGRESTSGTGCAIGPLQDRPGHQNDTWGHWSTDHFGLLNYLQTAEQAGAEPLLAVFARDLPSAPSARQPTQTTPTGDRLGTGVRRPALGTRRCSSRSKTSTSVGATGIRQLHVIAPSAGFSAKPGSTRSADRR